MEEYRNYYDEEEKPSPNPATRLVLGLIIGLLIGGIVGFALGMGSSGDGGLVTKDSPRLYVIATTIIAIAIMSIAIAVKRSSRGINGSYYPPQRAAVRLVVMGLALLLLLAFGAYFFFTQ